MERRLPVTDFQKQCKKAPKYSHDPSPQQEGVIVPEPRILQNVQWLYPIKKYHPYGTCIAQHPISDFMFRKSDLKIKEREYECWWDDNVLESAKVDMGHGFTDFEVRSKIDRGNVRKICTND